MIEIGIIFGPASLVILLVGLFTRNRVVRHALLIASGLLFLPFGVCAIVLKYGPD
jgi:hypothetical protein